MKVTYHFKEYTVNVYTPISPDFAAIQNKTISINKSRNRSIFLFQNLVQRSSSDVFGPIVLLSRTLCALCLTNLSHLTLK